MPTAPLLPGNHPAAIPVTVNPPAQSCAVDVVLTSDAAGVNIVYTSAQVAFTSNGLSQTQTVTVNIPATSPTLYAWVGVFVNGILVGMFAQGTSIVVPNVSVGNIGWS